VGTQGTVCKVTREGRRGENQGSEKRWTQSFDIEQGGIRDTKAAENEEGKPRGTFVASSE